MNQKITLPVNGCTHQIFQIGRNTTPEIFLYCDNVFIHYETVTMTVLYLKWSYPDPIDSVLAKPCSIKTSVIYKSIRYRQLI